MSADAALGRIGRVPGDLPILTDRVADDVVDDCLGRLALVVVDVTDIGATDVVGDALAQWQSARRVSIDTRRRLEAALVQRDIDGLAAHRASDLHSQRENFRAARGLACLAIVFGTVGGPRYRLREAAYEASVALGGSAGVVGVLVEFT